MRNNILSHSVNIILVGLLLTLQFISLQLYAENEYKDFIVCIDPGHQIKQNIDQEPIGPGATKTKPKVSSGTKGKIAGKEHSVVLDIGLRLHDILVQKGVIVVMTRVTPNVDISNSQRADLANRCKANLFIRLHCDAGSEHNCFTLYPANIEKWTDDIYEESLKAATIVQKRYASYVNIPDKGLIPRSDISGFNWSDVPVILPEMLHMGNPEDDLKVSTPEFRQKMAEGLAMGILEYLDTLKASDLPAGSTSNN